MFLKFNSAICAFAFIILNYAFFVHGDSIGFNSMCDSTISSKQFENLKAQGYTFFIGNYFNGALVTDPNTINGLYSGVNKNGIYCIGNASSITQLRDAYHIPKFTASAPLAYPSVSGPTTNRYAQARLPVDLLNAAKASIGRTWLVVLNGLGSNWSNNLTENEQFIREFVSYFPKPLGPQIGIMSTTEDYWRIVRSTFTISDSNSNPIQLWWSDCTNGYQDYTNFTAFNNWYQPVMHRYNCSISLISDQAEIKADLNWFA